MKNILIIAPRFNSLHRGVEVFTQYLASGLGQKKYRVTVLSGPHQNHEYENNQHTFQCAQSFIVRREMIQKHFGFLLNALPSRFLLSPSDIEALSLMLSSQNFLKRNQFDMVLPFGGTWTYRLAKRYCSNAKIISIGHAGPVKLNMELSDHFVALTPADQTNADHLCPTIKSSVIPNGVDVSLFTPKKEFINAVKPVILCVGAFTPDKHHELLLNAIEHLPEGIQFIFVGAGPNKQNIMRHPISKKRGIQFMEVPYVQMPNLYKLADVFTLPAPTEAFGLVFLEALANGLPVVAHDGQRQRFVIGESGIFCDVFNPISYADALKKALSLGADDRRLAQANRFSWPAIIGQYEILLNRLNEKKTI
jgi:glycosyltransferase involved in cell wall biosynthesis